MLSKFLKLWLLRSGIEWNPGPKRKVRKKCAKCQQFVTSSGLCNTCDYNPSLQVFEGVPPIAQTSSMQDVEDAPGPEVQTSTTQVELAETHFVDPSQEAASLALYRHINSAFTINAAGIPNLLEAGFVFGYFDSPRPTVFSHTDNNLLNYQIAELQNVGGDGACLFNVFSLLLFGNETAAGNIRRKICDVMPTIAFPLGTLFSNGKVCTTVEEYLQSSSMRYRYAYGGDAEVATFCSLTNLSVIVFVATINAWVVYKDIQSEESHETGPHVFLYLEGNHFQLVKMMNFIGNTAVIDVNVPTTINVPETIISSPSRSCFLTAIPNTFSCPTSIAPVIQNEPTKQSPVFNATQGNELLQIKQNVFVKIIQNNTYFVYGKKLGMK